KLDAFPGHPHFRLDDRTIADDDSAVRMARTECDLRTIGNRSLLFRRFLFRRIQRALSEHRRAWQNDWGYRDESRLDRRPDRPAQMLREAARRVFQRRRLHWRSILRKG